MRLAAGDAMIHVICSLLSYGSPGMSLPILPSLQLISLHAVLSVQSPLLVLEHDRADLFEARDTLPIGQRRHAVVPKIFANVFAGQSEQAVDPAAATADPGQQSSQDVAPVPENDPERHLLH